MHTANIFQCKILHVFDNLWFYTIQNPSARGKLIYRKKFVIRIAYNTKFHSSPSTFHTNTNLLPSYRLFCACVFLWSERLLFSFFFIFFTLLCDFCSFCGSPAKGKPIWEMQNCIATQQTLTQSREFLPPLTVSPLQSPSLSPLPLYPALHFDVAIRFCYLGT